MARAAAALAALGMLGACPEFACTCAGPVPACSEFWRTPLVFLGRVTSVEHVYDRPPEERIINGRTVTITGPGQYLAHFEVTKYYRGGGGNQITVHTADQGPACGYKFEEAREYLVYG